MSCIDDISGYTLRVAPGGNIFHVQNYVDYFYGVTRIVPKMGINEHNMTITGPKKSINELKKKQMSLQQA